MSPQTLPLVTISLVTYRPGHWLRPCLESALAQTYPRLELIVIDNANDEETERTVRSAMERHPNVRLIQSQKNLGFARAHNLGIAETEGALICLVNQDLVLDPNYVENVVRAFADAEVGSAQGRLLWLSPALERTDRVDSTGLVIHRSRRVVSRGQGSTDGPQNDRAGVVFGVDGACPIYRRAALEDVGVRAGSRVEYFDEDFFMYKEDVDLAWRLVLRGWKACYVPSAIAWHARGAGESAARGPWEIIRHRRAIPEWVKRLSWRNQRLMQAKNEDITMAVRDAPILLARELAAIAYLIFSGPGNARAVIDLFRLLPAALRKRRQIQRRRRVNRAAIERWFREV